MKLRELVEAICRSEGWTHQAEGSGFLLTLPQPQGRSQGVIASQFLEDGDLHVRYTSVVGPSSSLDEGRIRKALEINARLPHGCLAIEGGNLVLTETRPLATTTTASSASAIGYIARQADTYERLIYRTDVQ